MSFFDDLLVLNPAGRIVADYPELPGRAGVDASDRASSRDVVKTHQTVISEPLLGKTRGEPVVQVATPILTLDDRAGGRGGRRDPPLSIEPPRRLGEERIGETGYFAIMTRGPKPIYVVHPDRTRILKERPANGLRRGHQCHQRVTREAARVLSSTGADTIYSLEAAEGGALGDGRRGAEGRGARAAGGGAAPRLDHHGRSRPPR